MWAYHNSRDLGCRMPFGAVVAGRPVRMSIDVGDCAGCSCSLRVWVDGEGESFQAMEGVPAGDHVRFTCEFVRATPAIVWYSFIIERADGRVSRYGARQGRTGGKGELCDWQPPSFQITVYEPREVGPEWYDRGIVYQIFPDRFRRGDDWRTRTRLAISEHREGPARRVVSRWDVEPSYQKDAQGRVTAWDFYGGTLMGIREQLPGLAEFGVTTLYLNPIFEAASNHRYDTADFLRIDTMLGDEQGFRDLCAEARRHGISVILDGVFNHVGADSRYFNRYGNYPEPGAWQAHEDPAVSSAYSDWFHFNDGGTYDCWWGVDDLPAVDERAESYRDFICGPGGVVRHWLAAGASGWRLDVADELSDGFLAQIKQAALSERPDALVLGEVWEDASNKVSYGKLRRYLLGEELDSAMNYPFRAAVLDYLLGKMGATEASEQLASIVENYPPLAMRCALNLLSSHDRPRLMSVLGGALDHPEWQPWPDNVPGRLTPGERAMAKGRFWLAVLLQMCAEGVPSVYYGDEAGLEGLSDPYNRASYPWGAGDEDCRTMYRNAIQLRQALPVLVEGTMRPFSSGDDVLGWWREGVASEEASAAQAATEIAGATGDEGNVAVGPSDVVGPRVCVLVNRNMHACRRVTIPSRGLKATDLIGDAPLTHEGDGVSLTLGPLGSAVVMFDQARRLARPMPRGAGIVCHVTSVPNGGRPGTLGAPARAFVDFLARCGQRYWQILPVNPTYRFGSPYAGSSVFAGNEDLLEHDRAELRRLFEGFEPDEGYRVFCEANEEWLAPFCAFAAISDARFGQPWQDWPDDLRAGGASLEHDPRFEEGARYHRFCQYEFQREWDELHDYARERGVLVIGDIPMYPSASSADVWGDPSQFCVDAQGRVEVQAGTPPDQFARSGQLWGNPTYRWGAMAKDGYAWWMRRLGRMFALYDFVRLDHFLGFQNYYGVARGRTATEGTWHTGPGIALFRRAHELFGDLPLVAEDLGVITPAVRALHAQVGCPGMDVMLFCDGDVRNGWAPREGRIAYTSTHDTNTLVGWCASRYGLSRDDARSLAETLMSRAYESASDVVMAPLQDVMLLGEEGRMNVPGVAGGNWRWRADAEGLRACEPFLRNLTEDSERAASERAAR